MDGRVRPYVEYLNRNHIRATYGAIGDCIDETALNVGSKLLGHRHPFASWVVSASDGMPSGYSSEERHPNLLDNPEVIYDGEELKRRMREENG